MYIMSSNGDTQPLKPVGSIDFEETDFEQARAALEEPPAGVKVLRRLDPGYWLKRRKPAEPKDRELTAFAWRWLDELPPDVRPIDLPRSFPRIVNRLAESWHDVSACTALLAELVVDQRGDRRGFPMRVALELVALRDYRTRLARSSV